MPFALIEFVFYEKPERAVQTASEALVIEDYSAPLRDYESQSRISKYLHKVEDVIKPGQSVPELFDITLAIMRQWEILTRIDDEILWTGFLLKVMTFSGFAPSIFVCSSCNGELPGEGVIPFSPSSGGFLCNQCAKPEDVIWTSVYVLKLLRFLLENPFPAYEKMSKRKSDVKKAREIMEKFWNYYVGE